MLFTILTCSVISVQVSLWHIVIATISFLLCVLSISIKYLRNKLCLVAVCYSVFVGAIVYLCYSICFYQVTVDVIDDDKESYCINATLCDLPYKDGTKYIYKVKTSQIDNQDISTLVEVCTADKYDIDLYDNISFNCRLTSEVSGKYLSDKTFLIAYPLDDLKVTHNYKQSLYGSILDIKSNMLDALDNMYDTEILAIINALVIGDKSLITTDVSDSFRIAGLSHTLVLSGMHMSIISYILLITINKICKKKVISNIIVIILVLFFMVLTGLTPSIVRSGIATILMLVADMMNVDNDALNSLGFASAVLCLANPFVVFDVGMLLSFVSTVGIILYQNRLVKFIKSKLRFLNKDNFVCFVISNIVECLSLSVIASVATLPIMVLMFGSVSNITLLSNVLLVQTVPVIIALALISIVCYFVPILSFFIKAIVLINSVLVKVFVIIVDRLANISFASHSIDNLAFAILLSSLAVAIMLTFQFKNYFIYLPRVIFIFTLLFLGGYLWQDYNSNNYAQINIYSYKHSMVVDVKSLGNSAVIYTSDTPYITQTSVDVVAKNSHIDVLIIPDNKSSNQNIITDILQNLNAGLVCVANESLNPLVTNPKNTDNIPSTLQNQTICLNGTTNIKQVLVNEDFWIIIEVADTQILIPPYRTHKKDIQAFSDKYNLADFDVIISSKYAKKVHDKYFDTLNNWQVVESDILNNIKYLPNLSIKIPIKHGG